MNAQVLVTEKKISKAVVVVNKVQKKSKLSISQISINVFFIFYSLLCIIPLILALSISITDESVLLTAGYQLIPPKLSFGPYEYIISHFQMILNSYWITIVVTLVGTMLSIGVIALYAYPLSRKDFKYRNVFTFLMFVTMVFNGGLVPWYLVCTQVLMLQNTIWALILPYVFNAWYVIILRTFFQLNIPDSLIEAAKIDGCGEFRIFWKIVLPLSLPGLATVGMFQTLGYWNDWWLPLILTSKVGLINIQFLSYRLLANIQELAQSTNTDMSGQATTMPAEGARMALCMISAGPIIFAYPFFQKYFVKGLTVGAVKG